MIKDVNDLESGLRILIGYDPKDKATKIQAYFNNTPVHIEDYTLTGNDTLRLAKALKDIIDE